MGSCEKMSKGVWGNIIIHSTPKLIKWTKNVYCISCRSPAFSARKSTGINGENFTGDNTIRPPNKMALIRVFIFHKINCFWRLLLFSGLSTFLYSNNVRSYLTHKEWYLNPRNEKCEKEIFFNLLIWCYARKLSRIFKNDTDRTAWEWPYITVIMRHFLSNFCYTPTFFSLLYFSDS